MSNNINASSKTTKTKEKISQIRVIEDSIKRHILTLLFPGFSKPERKEEPAIYHLGQYDHEMNRAIERARQSLNKFNEALQSDNPDFHFFCLKKQFKTFDQTEHIWITDIHLKENKYVGTVANLPRFTNDVNANDTIEVDIDTISDWMYLDKQLLKGGYTIRILRDRMTMMGRKQFDTKNGLTFEE